MTRLESAAWPLAFGGASVFVLAVVLDRLAWPVAFAAVAAAVAGWAWRGPVVVGAAVAVIGWLCVTGFDVHRFGEIGVIRGDDVARGVTLLGLGVVAGSVHAGVAAVRSHRRADPVWVAFHEADPESRIEVPSPSLSADSGPAHGLRIEKGNGRDG